MQAKSKDLAEKDQNNQENIKRQSHYWGENEKRAELFENDIWYNILEKFKQTYNDRYYNLKGNILG